MKKHFIGLFALAHSFTLASELPTSLPSAADNNLQPTTAVAASLQTTTTQSPQPATVQPQLPPLRPLSNEIIQLADRTYDIFHNLFKQSNLFSLQAIDDTIRERNILLNNIIPIDTWFKIVSNSYLELPYIFSKHNLDLFFSIGDRVLETPKGRLAILCFASLLNYLAQDYVDRAHDYCLPLNLDSFLRLDPEYLLSFCEDFIEKRNRTVSADALMKNRSVPFLGHIMLPFQWLNNDRVTTYPRVYFYRLPKLSYGSSHLFPSYLPKFARRNVIPHANLLPACGIAEEFKKYGSVFPDYIKRAILFSVSFKEFFSDPNFDEYKAYFGKYGILIDKLRYFGAPSIVRGLCQLNPENRDYYNELLVASNEELLNKFRQFIDRTPITEPSETKKAEEDDRDYRNFIVSTVNYGLDNLLSYRDRIISFLAAIKYNESIETGSRQIIIELGRYEEEIGPCVSHINQLAFFHSDTMLLKTWPRRILRLKLESVNRKNRSDDIVSSYPYFGDSLAAAARITQHELGHIIFNLLALYPPQSYISLLDLFKMNTVANSDKTTEENYQRMEAENYFQKGSAMRRMFFNDVDNSELNVKERFLKKVISCRMWTNLREIIQIRGLLQLGEWTFVNVLSDTRLIHINFYIDRYQHCYGLNNNHPALEMLGLLSILHGIDFNKYREVTNKKTYNMSLKMAYREKLKEDASNKTAIIPYRYYNYRWN